jgi:hypothetical protein
MTVLMCCTPKLSFAWENHMFTRTVVKLATSSLTTHTHTHTHTNTHTHTSLTHTLNDHHYTHLHLHTHTPAGGKWWEFASTC